MRVDLGQLIVRNWPIKLAALFLAVMMYIAVEAQQPIRQAFDLKLSLELPPGRSLRQEPPHVSVVIAGKGSELLKLRSFPGVIKKTVPDTLSASVWAIRLEPSDVDVTKGADVQVVDITPKQIEVALDSVAVKDVPIVPLLTVVADSGYELQGGVSIVPNLARVHGPEPSLAAVESVTTIPTVIDKVNGPFTRIVLIDTAALGVVRVSPKQIEVSGELWALSERTILAVPVETGAGALTSFRVNPARVSVAVRGPERLVQALTRDSLKVIAHLAGPVQAGAFAHLTVVAPAGITAWAIPDSVALLRRRGASGG